MTSNSSILWCTEVNSALLNHVDRDSGKLSTWRGDQALWKSDLYAIHFPFLLESQLERIQRESKTDEQDNTDRIMTSAQRKRKKRERHTRSLPPSEVATVALISCALESVIGRARKVGLMRDVTYANAMKLSDNNTSAQAAANAPGCGSLFHSVVHEEKTPDFSHLPSLMLDPDLHSTLSLSDVLQRPVRNGSDQTVAMKIEGHKFMIPAYSTFMTSSFQHFVTDGFSQLTVQPGYDLVVIDPPWRNKSVKRKKSYHVLTESDLINIPMQRLCGPGALVCVWLTNNSRLKEFVKEQLLPAWAVRYLATWLWVKVTSSGEPVCDLYSQHKKPYEQILIGRFERNLGLDSCHLISNTIEQEKLNSFNGKVSPSTELGSRSQSSLHNDTTHDAKAKCSASSVSFVKNDTVRNVASFLSWLENGNECSSKQSQDQNIDAYPFNALSKKTMDEKDKLVQDSFEDDSVRKHCDHFALEIPERFILVSVPCALHSKKPVLSDALQPYLPMRPQSLELFARNLNPGWVSWGDEPLCHQHVDFMERSFPPV